MSIWASLKTNTMKRIFKLEEVLSAVKGVLLCPIDKVYEVLNFLTGENLYTDQLPRAGRECAEPVFMQHPWLKEIDVSDINPQNWQQQLAEIKERHPSDVELSPVGTYQAKDPIKEIVEMCGGDEGVIVVNI